MSLTPDPETGGNKISAEFLELQEPQRANFLLGRLLQVFPDKPIDAHMQSVIDGIDAFKPQGGINAGNRSMYGFGQPIEDEYGRAYIVLESLGREATVFYRSNSHAVWRALLSQASDGYIAKGMFGVENSADAPLRLQKKLTELAERDVARGMHYMELLYALHNDRQDIGSKPAADAIAEAKMRMAFISPTPKYSERDILSDVPGEFFVEPKTPNFDQVVDDWTSTHPMYGNMESVVYPSMDETLNYQVNAAHYGDRMQRWVGTAEVAEAGVGYLALKREFPEIPAELLKPPIDYEGHSSKYGARREDVSQFEQFATEAGVS